MIKAVIFDLNGIFIQSQKLSERFKEKFGVPINEFISALQSVMPKMRMPGAEDSFTYWEPYLEKWNVHLTKEEFFGKWGQPPF